MKPSVAAAVFAAVVCTVVVPPLAAVPTLTLAPSSHLWLTGDSTLHPYGSTSTLTQVEVVFSTPTPPPGASPATALTLADIARQAPFETFRVIIPVKGLKSGESGLDKNMYKAMKADTVSDIRFTMTRYDASAGADASSVAFHAEGVLSIAGVEKPVVLLGAANAGNEALTVDGSYALKMTDYGIKPPTLLLGAIKVADPVTVHYHLVFQLSKGVTP